MATHSSILAWRIPGTGQPGGLPSMGLYRVGHDRSYLAAANIMIADANFSLSNLPKTRYQFILFSVSLQNLRIFELKSTL